MRMNPNDSQLVCPYRILMTADSVGGVWNYSVDLSRELCRRGATVLLATFGPRPGEAQRALAQSIRNLRVVESEFALEWTPDVQDRELYDGGQWLLDQAAAFQPDFVHINGYFHAGLSWKIPTVVVAHSCVYSWWLSTHGTFPPSHWQAYHQRVSDGIAAAQTIVAPSRFMLQSVQHIYSLATSNGHVIYNFSTIPRTSATKENIIFASGRYWDPAKNIAILNKISPKLPWPIYLAGRTAGPSGEREHCSGFTCLGELNRIQMANALSRASIFVHPAKYEPFGLSVLEAAMSSCALVLSDIPSLRELWEDCALYAHPDDEKQWIEHILHLIQDTPFRHQLARKAFQRAEVFSPERSIAGYLSLYHSLVHDGAASAHRPAV